MAAAYRSSLRKRKGGTNANDRKHCKAICLWPIVLINLIILAKTQKENNNLTMGMILDEQHTFVNNRGLPIISICEHLVGIKIKTDKRK